MCVADVSQDAVNGIESQAIEMKITQPHECVVAEKSAHLGTFRPVEVNALAPKRCKLFREVWPELPQIIS